MGLSSDELRQVARRQLQERRDFVPHLLVYILVNGVLALVWAMTSRGLFWPGFVLAAWGVGLLMHAWSAFLRRPITEADLDRYVAKLSGRTGGSNPT